MSNKVVSTAQNGSNDDRRSWVEPEVIIMTASDSEAGANPVQPEGLAMGS